ncbi:MAG: Uma2 family endonuclease [Acidobacteriia bacterium]|nr:Uma2 family endonuclease [Terriglobia bacterium]
MSSQPTTFVSEAEYLERERKAERKSEYYKGEMFAMAGASPRHAEIVTNLVAEFRQRLKTKPCKVYSTDVRLRVTPTGLYTYPDVIVVCGPPQFADDQKDTLLNPTVIVEVLSVSTKDYDRGRKFDHYRTLPSLMEYLTVAQDVPHIQLWARQKENGWLLSDFDEAGQIMPLRSIECDLPLAEVYDKLEWIAT